MRSECIFFCPVRVRYGEVDQQGIVYNGNYVVYTDLAFEEFFRSKGYPYRVLAEQYGSEVCHKKSTRQKSRHSVHMKETFWKSASVT